jgi:hypothetical protein
MQQRGNKGWTVIRFINWDKTYFGWPRTTVSDLVIPAEIPSNQ